MDKVDWDVFFMAHAFLTSQKSIDPSTKHGSVLVSKDNRILSTGYNGPLKNIDDSKVPLTRPEKYYWLIHSEENCLLSYNGSVRDIEDSRIYITGRPCYRCLRMILQKGIKKIIYAGVGSFCIDEEDLKHQEGMLSLKNSIEIISFKDIDKVKDFMLKGIDALNKIKEG